MREVESSASQLITEFIYSCLSFCCATMWSTTSFQHVAGVGASAFCTFTHSRTISPPNSSRHATFYLIRSVKSFVPAAPGRALRRRRRVAAQSTTTFNPSPTFTQDAFEDFLVNLQRSICEQVHLIPYQLLLVVLGMTDLFFSFSVCNFIIELNDVLHGRKGRNAHSLSHSFLQGDFLQEIGHVKNWGISTVFISGK